MDFRELPRIGRGATLRIRALVERSDAIVYLRRFCMS